MALEFRTMSIQVEIVCNVANRTSWDGGTVLYSDWNVVYMGVYICKNSSYYTLKIHLKVFKFHFNKKLKASKQQNHRHKNKWTK